MLQASVQTTSTALNQPDPGTKKNHLKTHYFKIENFCQNFSFQENMRLQKKSIRHYLRMKNAFSCTVHNTFGWEKKIHFLSFDLLCRMKLQNFSSTFFSMNEKLNAHIVSKYMQDILRIVKSISLWRSWKMFFNFKEKKGTAKKCKWINKFSINA